MIKAIGVTFFFIAAYVQLQAQGNSTKVLIVNPSETAPGIEIIHGGHYAVYNTAVPSTHKLFLMIVGTGGAASQLRQMDSIVAGLGYHAISIDYKNNVITTVCNNSTDSACFDKFRQEIMFGTPVSNSVNVDSTNSIINRFQKLMEWLVKNDPQGGWGEFIKNGNIQWNKIDVGGHSQGAGHCINIGKHFKVNRVLIFSGPQDYRVVFNSPALWLGNKSATPLNRYYAFLHLQDQYMVSRQLESCAKAMGTPGPDSANIQPGMPLQTRKHILVNNIPANNPHMTTLLPVFKNVWAYMLGMK
ncbi:MAG TPA: hypothetical protein VHB48_17380 [Chitinophagaceae bacterium]|nr:hypothetical protein [Chitinophagaceae bacterium]